MAPDSPRPAYPWLQSYPSFADWDMDIPPRAAFEDFLRAAEQFPDRPCMEFLGRRWTYAETADRVRKAVRGFQELGVKKGSKVGICLPNTPFYPITFMAILMAGGTVVNINPLYAEREMEILAKDSGATIIVTADLAQIFPKVDRLFDDTPLEHIVLCPFADALPLAKSILFRVFKRGDVVRPKNDPRYVSYHELIDNDGVFTPVEIDPVNDLAVFQYTGGTTGLPKGAMLTHSNLTANATQVTVWHGEVDYGNERILAALPFFHVFAMTVCMMTAFKVGAEIVMMPRFNLKDCLKTIERTKPSYFPAVPTIYTAINNAPDVQKYDLTSLKACISGGAPLPVEVKKTFEQKTGCTVVEGYGLSETSPVLTTNPLEGANKAGSVGIPMPGTLVEIISLEDGVTPMPVGEKGEVCGSGPQVMQGYWNKPEETAEVLKNGRFHTGDVGYMDEDGYIFLVDRLKDLILAGGYNVYPRMVEEAFYLHEGVEECTVIGIDHEYRGQAPKAFVKLKEGVSLTEDELFAFLKDKLSKIEMPEEIEFRDDLPKTLIGKLSKKELTAEEQAQEKTEGDKS